MPATSVAIDPFDRNYCNDDCPILSFVFAICSDDEYARAVSERWRRDPSSTAYLDHYRKNPSRFPKGAQILIHEDVPRKGVKVGNLYKPSPQQCRDLIRDYLVSELTGEHVAGQQLASLPPFLAFDDPNRPTLATLARIFINRERLRPDDEILTEVPRAAKEVLTGATFSEAGRPTLTKVQVEQIEEALVADLAKDPAVW
jgi:hypothetical protein